MANADKDGLYEHKPLSKDTEPISIRLLLLHPAPKDNPIVGQIVERKLNQKYEALSYCWGAKHDASKPEYISIMDDTRYSKLEIRPNLASALMQLRNESGAFRPLWIDAVCIDQENDAEKSEQIPLMDTIFQNAERVCIWLGDAAGDADDLAIGHIREIIKLEGFESLIKKEYTDQWAALASLMRREWFSRRWVVQEIAYARQAMVYWGTQSIDWKELADAVALFGSRAPEIAELFRHDSKYDNRSDFLGDVEALSANRLVNTIGKVFRKADNGQRVERLLSLEALISNLSAFNASRPHDIIYSVLSLAKGTITSAKKPKDPLQSRKRAVSSSAVPSRRPSISGPFRDDVASETGSNGVSSNLQPGNIPSTQVTDMTSIFDQMSDNPDESFARIRQQGFDEKVINKALERIQKHMEVMLQSVDNDSIAALESAGLLAIGPDFWDEESREWTAKGIRGLYSLAHKLLHQEKPVLALVNNMLHIMQGKVKLKTFHVDYQKQFYEVCKDFVYFTIVSSRSLDMLCRPWAPDAEDLPDYENEVANLPSWICPLSKSPFLSRPDGAFGRINADLLVGMPDSGSSIYTTSKDTGPGGAFFGGDGERVLFVTGLVIDEIRVSATEAVEGNIPSSWLTLGNWENTKTDPPPESFWRTIVADRTENGQNPPSYYQRACQYAFAQRISKGSLNIDRLIQRKISRVMTDYLKRVQAVVWMRKLIRTYYNDPELEETKSPNTHLDNNIVNGVSSPSHQGRLGLVPHTARQGDKICMLRGCSVPVVLRTIQKPIAERDVKTQEKLRKLESQATGTKWNNMTCKIIGECYIHGIMDGEVFRIRDSKERPLVDTIFEIE